MAAHVDSAEHLHYIRVFFLWALILAVCLYFLTPVKVLLLGLLAAGAMAATLYPLTCRIPANRWTQAAIVGMLPILLMLGLVVGASWFLSSALARQLENWPEIQRQLDSTLATWSGHFGLQQPLTTKDLASQLGTLLTGSGGQGVFSTTTNFLSNVMIAVTFVFIGAVFFLGERPSRLLQPILLLAPEQRREQVRDSFYWLAPKLRWWVLGTLFSMVVIALVTGVGYQLVGLPMAFPIALLGGLAQVVPTFGPLVTFAIALVVAAAQGSGTVLGVTIVYIIVQSLEAYLLTPYVMKKATDEPPIITLFTVVLWGQVFGLSGLLLAVPINLVIWGFLDHLVLQPRAAEARGCREK